MRIGGPKNTTNAIQAAGGEVGPRTMWLGAWNLKSGYGSLRPFLEECKADGVDPLLHFWFWGDDLQNANIHAVLTGGVQDKYQNVWKDWNLAKGMANEIVQAAKDTGTNPIVTIELEFNKGGKLVEKMRDYLWDMRNTLKDGHRGIRTVFAPGAWGDLAALGEFYRSVARSMDYIGLQALKFEPRHGDYTGAPAALRDAFKVLRNIIDTAKPTCVYDCGFSTYAGGAKTHPFANGNGSLYDDKQAKAIADLALLESVGIDFLVYRNLKDNPKFDIANYGGYAERHLGVVRSDGTRKTGYDKLITLALPVASPAPEPEPPAPEPPAPEPDPHELLAQRLAKVEDTLISMANAHTAALETINAVFERLDAIEQKVVAQRQQMDDAAKALAQTRQD